jgi:hypothetical protein
VKAPPAANRIGALEINLAFRKHDKLSQTSPKTKSNRQFHAYPNFFGTFQDHSRDDADSDDEDEEDYHNKLNEKWLIYNLHSKLATGRWNSLTDIFSWIG